MKILREGADSDDVGVRVHDMSFLISKVLHYPFLPSFPSPAPFFPLIFSYVVAGQAVVGTGF